MGYAEREQLQAVYSAYLRPILGRQLAKHPFWQSSAKVHALAGSMLELFERTRAAFSQVRQRQCLISQWVRDVNGQGGPRAGGPGRGPLGPRAERAKTGLINL